MLCGRYVRQMANHELYVRYASYSVWSLLLYVMNSSLTVALLELVNSLLKALSMLFLHPFPVLRPRAGLWVILTDCPLCPQLLVQQYSNTAYALTALLNLLNFLLDCIVLRLHHQDGAEV